MKMKNRSHKYDINGPRPRHEHKHSTYKKCLTMMMLICIKQHLSNLSISIQEMLSNAEAELKKSLAYKKSVCIANIVQGFFLLTVFSKKLHHRRLTEYQVRLCLIE